MKIINSEEIIKISFKVNGKEVVIDTLPTKRLLDILREDLGLTGTKEGCSVGECGACTVIMNKKAVNSCLVSAVQLEGSEILTIEGLSSDGELDPLQESFVNMNAISCGFCTPGVIMSAKALLMNNPKPTEEEIKIAISGNLCRCTGYENLVRAVQAVIE